MIHLFGGSFGVRCCVNFHTTIDLTRDYSQLLITGEEKFSHNSLFAFNQHLIPPPLFLPYFNQMHLQMQCLSVLSLCDDGKITHTFCKKTFMVSKTFFKYK